MRCRSAFFCFFAFAMASGCQDQTAPLVSIPSRAVDQQKITLGSAQTLRVGMSGADVVNALSSPNIVTSNSDGGETWVYDRKYNEFEIVSVSNNEWILRPRTSSSAVQVSSQKTLIVVISFDRKRLVKEVLYRMTSF